MSLIARDASSQSQSGAGVGSLTWSHTCTGSERILFVGAYDNSATDDITGVTYGGIAMTKIGASVAVPSSGDYQNLWYLIAPATGANDITISRSGSSGRIGGSAVSYTGADQTAPIDASTTNTAAAAASIATAVTSVTKNCWTLLIVSTDDGSDSAGANSTYITAPSGVLNSPAIYDGNAKKNIGSNSMTINSDGSANMATVMVSLKAATTIAFDASSTGSGSGVTSITYAHTCTGLNGILFVGVFDQSGGDNVSGVTYNSVAMTKVASVEQGTSTRWVSLWYLVAPATGANNVVVTRSSSSNSLEGRALSYTGVLQTSPIDVSDTDTTNSGTALTISATSTTDNCWFVGIFRNGSDVNVASTNTIMRGASSSISMGDSNGVTSPAGLDTIGVTWSGASSAGAVGAAFKPFVASAVSPSRLGLMGVGK